MTLTNSSLDKLNIEKEFFKLKRDKENFVKYKEIPDIKFKHWKIKNNTNTPITQKFNLDHLKFNKPERSFKGGDANYKGDIGLKSQMFFFRHNLNKSTQSIFEIFNKNLNYEKFGEKNNAFRKYQKHD